MNKTELHKQKILEMLKTAGTLGVNSKRFINEVTPRYSARIQDLENEGYSFITKREAIGGSNFIRVWLKDMAPRAVQKPLRWEFDNGTGIARAIYG